MFCATQRALRAGAPAATSAGTVAAAAATAAPLLLPLLRSAAAGPRRPGAACTGTANCGSHTCICSSCSGWSRLPGEACASGLQQAGPAAGAARAAVVATGPAAAVQLQPLLHRLPATSPCATRFFSAHAAKRRRTAAPAAATTDAAPGAGSRAAAQPQSPPRPALTSGLGQVIGAASQYVRVQLHALLPDDAPTPPEWRPYQAQPPAPSPASAAAAAPGYSHDTAPSSAPSHIPGAGTPSQAEPPPLPHDGQLLCSVRGLLRKLRQEVLVGDYVRVRSVDWPAGRGVVDEVLLPRSSRLLDPAVANVDHVVLVFALDQPPFEELQVSRFLVAAEASGLPLTLCLNKADLVPPADLQRRVEQCRSWGYEPLVLSCETGEGVEVIAGRLQDRTSVVAGPSGAGKSSLINCLRRGRHRPDLLAAAAATEGEEQAAAASAQAGDGVDAAAGGAPLQPLPVLAARLRAGGAGRGPGESARGEERSDASAGAAGDGCCASVRSALDGASASASASASAAGSWASEEDEAPSFQAVGELSRMGRGMHTTTSVSLLQLLGGGWLADTPGFGQPTLEDITSQQLASLFPELHDLPPCRFSDCLHVAEPGCSVSGAGLARYSHYLYFLRDIKAREEEDVGRLQRAKAEREGYAKVKSTRGGGERLEARLDSKRHRRASRQSGKRSDPFAD